MTSLVWLFFGMTVSITTLIVNRLTVWYFRRKVNRMTRLIEELTSPLIQ